MVDVSAISTGLKLGKDGIWYSTDTESISYLSRGNEACSLIEDSSFWFRHRNNCIVSIIKSYPPENNEAIFDIGGGNGFVSLGLANAGFDVIMVEPGPVGASLAKKRGIKNIICATTYTAKFKQETISAIGLFDVIEHIEDDFAFLKSIINLMKKKGRLYMSVPSYPFFWSAEDVLAGHYRRYTLNDISAVLQKVGFQIEFSSYIFRILPIPILLLRALPYKIGLSRAKTYNTSERVHTVKNRIALSTLSLILRSEIKNLNNKKAMSFGSSCLIVAKRP